MGGSVPTGSRVDTAVSALTDLAIRPDDPKRQFRFTLGLYTISDLNKLLSTVVDALLTVTGMERGYAILREQRLICFRSLRSRGPDYFDPEQFFFSHAIVEQVFEKREIHYSLYPQTSFSSSLSLKTVLGIPLTFQGDLEGGEESRVLGVIYTESDRIVPYSEEQLELFSILGGHAAMAVENTRLYEMAMVDHLTELYRRHFILSQLKIEWQRSVRHYYPLSVAMVDIDHFKAVNDEHGHARGDEVLREVAKTLKHGIRMEDSLGRYGGEEFLLILPQTCTEEGVILANRLCERVRCASFDFMNHPVTISVGIASFPTHETEDTAELMNKADLALYRAKYLGRDRVCVFQSAHS